MIKEYKYKKTIVFNYNSIEHFFFQIVNIGEKGVDDFKFIFNNPEGGTSNIYMDEGLKLDSDSVIAPYGELTYHPDSSILYKTPNYPLKSREHINPEKTGYRRTPISEIKDWEALFTFKIYDYNLCRLISELDTEEKYVIDDLDVISRGLPFYSLVSFVRDSFIIPKPYFASLEKNIIIKDIGEDLNLWIFLSPAKENGYWIEIDNGNKKVYSQNNKIEIMERKY